jgi:hypothetical protein
MQRQQKQTTCSFFRTISHLPLISRGRVRDDHGKESNLIANKDIKIIFNVKFEWDEEF